jgi:hypothetical protein
LPLTSEWLTPGRRRAKTIMNCVINRWGDGPDTPAGVGDRAARQHDPSLEDLLARIDDTIAAAMPEERAANGASDHELRLSRGDPVARALVEAVHAGEVGSLTVLLGEHPLRASWMTRAARLRRCTRRQTGRGSSRTDRRWSPL